MPAPARGTVRSRAPRWTRETAPGGTLSGVINGVNRTFTLTYNPSTDLEFVELNGITEDEGVDYSMSGRTLTMTVAPSAGDTLKIRYQK